MSALLPQIAGSTFVRKIADAGFVRVAHARTAALDAMDVPAVQGRILRKLVRTAADTQFGRDHGFASIRTAADYQRQVPVRTYEQFWNEYWKSVYPRLQGTTWPHFIPYYALSSGTTSGSTKYVPVSKEMVRSNQKAAFTTTALFRHSFPKADIFAGKFFFLGGSTDMKLQEDGSYVGDLSGVAAKEVADFMRPYSFPPLELGLVADWDVKMSRLAEAAVHEPITALSGVPSWMVLLIDRLKQISGKKTLLDIWPGLRLIVHGGTKFDPYRDLFRRECGSDIVTFCDVYPSSEGFIATEDHRYPQLLRLVPDHDIFFEFVPLSEFDSNGKLPPFPVRHTMANVQTGVPYAILLTTCAGFWSNLLGDTVEFESVNPPLLRFTGRTKFFLSAFGEHLIQEEVDSAVAIAARNCGVLTVDHHVGPLFPDDPKSPGKHLYLVEFRDGPPADVNRFALEIDRELIRLNEDYAAHRKNDLTMFAPEVRVVPPGGFGEWMKSRGRYGGQNKVPRMDNDGTITKQLAGWLAARS